MKKYINILFAMGVFLLVAASCSDDATLTTLQEVRFSAPAIATPNTIVLSSENKYESVVTISWADVDYPVDAPITYALQFDVASDTIGNSAWGNSIRIEAGEAVLSKSFLGSELNEIAVDLGLPYDAVGELVVRVEANLDRKTFSSAAVVNVTPFFEQITLAQIYVPGAYQGWTPNTAGTLAAIENGVFQGFLTFPAGQLEFKFTTEGNWEEFYGLDTDGNFAEGGDTNLSVPAAGSYQITVNLNTLTYTAVPYSWGVIGTATPGGWDSDTDMSYDYQDKVWTFTGNLVGGALKFRLNNAWTINYGSINNTEFIAYLDNPGAHTIPEAGNYTVTFDHDPANPASAPYTIQLN